VPPPSPRAPPPPPPPLPPRPPAIPPPAPPFALLNSINRRFSAFVPGSSELDKVGILLHSVDGMEQQGKPWQAATRGPNVDAGLSDRISCSVVWKGQAQSFMDNDSGLYEGQGGYIVSPSHARPLCAYGGDGATRGKTCNPPGPSKTCIPACIPQYNGHNSVHEYDSWCDRAGETDHWCNGRPWRPQDLGKMLSRDRLATKRGVQSNEPQRLYNELVLDGLYSNRNLPHSIEAFVLSPGDNVALVRESHQAFLRIYRLTARDVPLLVYHPGVSFGCHVCS